MSAVDEAAARGREIMQCAGYSSMVGLLADLDAYAEEIGLANSIVELAVYAHARHEQRKADATPEGQERRAAARRLQYLGGF